MAVITEIVIPSNTIVSFKLLETSNPKANIGAMTHHKKFTTIQRVIQSLMALR